MTDEQQPDPGQTPGDPLYALGALRVAAMMAAKKNDRLLEERIAANERPADHRVIRVVVEMSGRGRARSSVHTVSLFHWPEGEKLTQDDVTVFVADMVANEVRSLQYEVPATLPDIAPKEWFER